VNGWLWAAAVLTAALVPLCVVAVRRPAADGFVALQTAGSDAVLILMLISEGTHRQPMIDLALVLALVAFAGGVGFVRFLREA
jgi:multisubunit Na+/H+ antiporter MnhF subunit